MFWRAGSRTLQMRAASQYRQPLSHRNLTPHSIPWQGYQRIGARTYTTREAAKLLFRKYPFTVSLATFCILSGAGAIVYANYIYRTYILGVFQPFPEPVAKPLRRALYYTNISLSPKDALKYYKQALNIADEIGMDPFSDEILGVKIQVASLMEKIQNYDKAIGVLEIVRKDCQRWLDEMGGKPGKEGQRTKVLGKMVGISVKLGELYANEYVMDKETAEERLVWAVETVLKEIKRRDQEGVKEGEGEWMTDEETGGALESLGNHYEQKSQHYLAAPLFLQCLAFTPTNNCHAVVLMNNLSISLAQQLPPSQPGTTGSSRLTLLDSARSWAEKAIATASTIPADNRTEECDIGCAVATHNLGEFAEMAGNFAEARRKYQDAKELAQRLGFHEGVENSEKGIERVKGK